MNKQKIVDEVKPLIDKFAIICFSVLKVHDRKSLRPENKHAVEFLLEITKRTYYNIKSIQKILNEYITDNVYDHSIGLLLRGSLSDIITVAYLNSNNATEELNIDWYNEEVKKYLCDHIYFTQKTFPKIETRQNKQKEFDELLQSKFPDLVEIIDGKLKVKYPNAKTQNQIVTKLKENPTSKIFEGAWLHWNYYSKYEHYGAFTYNFQRIDVQNNFKRILHSLSFLILKRL